MYIAYLDESGTHSEARYFVVAGLAVFERDTYFLAQGLDQLEAQYFPDATAPIAFHASTLRSDPGRKDDPYNALTTNQRHELIGDIYQRIANSKARLFAVAMEKACMTEDAYGRGFEEIVNRFDRMLARILRAQGEPQRGLIVIAESSYRENLEVLAQRIWSKGHRWGETYNLADIPYFAPAKSTRLLQLADFVANAVYGKYESGYGRYFDQIIARFDQHEGRMHGLVHIHVNQRECYCPACLSRRAIPRPEPE